MLGQLYSDDDKQVFSTVGGLLLAKVLTDQGWEVEHEPRIGDATPDLRITLFPHGDRYAVHGGWEAPAD